MGWYLARPVLVRINLRNGQSMSGWVTSWSWEKTAIRTAFGWTHSGHFPKIRTVEAGEIIGISEIERMLLPRLFRK